MWSRFVVLVLLKSRRVDWVYVCFDCCCMLCQVMAILTMHREQCIILGSLVLSYNAQHRARMVACFIRPVGSKGGTKCSLQSAVCLLVVFWYRIPGRRGLTPSDTIREACDPVLDWRKYGKCLARTSLTTCASSRVPNNRFCICTSGKMWYRTMGIWSPRTRRAGVRGGDLNG